MIIRKTPDPYSDIPFLRKFSDYQLYEMYTALVSGKWPEMLGAAPKGFDDLPIATPKKRFRKKTQKSKRDYTEPVRKYIYHLVGWEKMNEMAYSQRSLDEKIYSDLMEANPGTKTEILEELAEHLAKNLDL